MAKQRHEPSALRSPTQRHRAIGQLASAPALVAQLFPDLVVAEQEAMWVLGLDSRHRVVTVTMAALGTADCVTVVGRDVFRELVRRNCVRFVLVHNHPSGEPSPSINDVDLTRKFHDAGALLGIQLVDHVIVARRGYYSFSNAGLVPIASPK